MKYSKGDIVVVKFPFLIREKEIQKGRPALIISNAAIKRRYDDYTLAAITSQIPSNIMELEIRLEPDKSNGLVKESLLRLDFIMTIPTELISRKIGSLSQKIMDEVDKKLKLLFKLS